MTRAEKKSGKSALKAVSSHEDAYSTWRQWPGHVCCAAHVQVRCSN